MKKKHNWITPKPDINKYKKQSLYHDVEDYYIDIEDFDRDFKNIFDKELPQKEE